MAYLESQADQYLSNLNTTWIHLNPTDCQRCETPKQWESWPTFRPSSVPSSAPAPGSSNTALRIWDPSFEATPCTQPTVLKIWDKVRSVPVLKEEPELLVVMNVGAVVIASWRCMCGSSWPERWNLWCQRPQRLRNFARADSASVVRMTLSSLEFRLHYAFIARAMANYQFSIGLGSWQLAQAVISFHFCQVPSVTCVLLQVQ